MNDGRTKKSLINIFGNLSQQIIIIILTFVSRTVFIKTLGVEYLGINGLFADILGLLSMADLGFNTAMVYSFYKPLADNDHDKIAALITFYKKLYNIIAIAVCLIGIGLVPFIRLLVNMETDIPLLEVYYLFSVANIVVSYLWVYKTSILTADQRNYYISRIQIVSNLCKTILQVAVLCFFKSYIAYLSLGVFFAFVTNIIASKKAAHLYPYVNYKKKLDKSEVKKIFSTLRSVFVFKLSSVLLNATDNTLISVIVGTVAVGYYSNYLMINTKLIAIFSLFFTSVTASIGNLIVKENAEKRYEIFKCAQVVSYIFCGIVIPCYTALINDFISLWIGNHFCLKQSVVFIIGLNLFISCAMQPLWSYREATGLYTKTKWVMLICAIINIILSIVLGCWLGVGGILLASVISRVTTYVWYEPKLLFKLYFERKPDSYFIQLIVNFGIVVIWSFILNYASFIYNANSWVSFLIKSLIMGTVSMVLLLICYSKTGEYKRIYNIVKRKFIKAR